MRPGPPVEALVGGYGVGARVAVKRGGEVLAVDVPVDDVVYEYTAGRAVPSRVTYTAPHEWIPEHPLSPLNNYGQRSHLTGLVEIGGDTIEVPLGEYLHTEWEETRDGVQVTALDLMQIPAENPAAFPSSPPANSMVSGELQRLAAGLPVIMDSGDTAADRNIQFGHDRVEAIADLCEAHGLDYTVRSDGYLHVWSRSDSRVPLATYTALDLLDDAPRAHTPRRPNRWLVVGDEKSRAQAHVENSSFPYEPEAYGRVTSRVELQSATDSRQTRAHAEHLMRAASETQRIRSLQITTDMRIEGGDIIAAVTGTGEEIVGRVHAIVMPLTDPSALMRVDVEVLEW